MPVPTVGQTITARVNSEVLKGTALVVAANHVVFTRTNKDDAVSVTPLVVPVSAVLTAV